MNAHEAIDIVLNLAKERLDYEHPATDLEREKRAIDLVESLKQMTIEIHPRIKHLKRGSTYKVWGEAQVQVSAGQVPVADFVIDKARVVRDGDKITVYQSETDGALYARFADEFTPDRFEELADA